MDHDTQNGMPKVVCKPQSRETQIMRFQRFVEKKRSRKFKDYWDFHLWSTEEISEFWGDVWDFFGIKYSEPYTQVFSGDPTTGNVKWFEGARLNYTQNILKYRDAKTAIIATDDDDNAQYITYEQLYEEVRVYITAFKGLGIKAGDVLCCYMSNKVEAIYAFLAAAAIGGLWCGVLPLLGTKSVLTRFEQVDPKILFVAGNFFFDGTEIRMDVKIPEIVENLPTLVKVVYVPAKSKDVVEDISNIPKCTFVKDFLKDARSKLEGDSSPLEFQQFPFEQPLSVCFTSGTTGNPKVLIHHNGIILTSVKDYGIHQDITRDDVILHYSPVGWVTWNMIVNSLHLGTTICVYEGFPFAGKRFYDVVDKYGITTAFIWSSTVEEMEKGQILPDAQHSLKTLKQLYPMGSVTKPHCIEFLLQKVNPGMFCTSAYGTTEAYGTISGMNQNLPVFWDEIQGISLGMDLKILNNNGEPVLGERGDVVLAKPFPGNVMKVLNDHDGKIFKKLYLDKHPGYYSIGDDGYINPKTKGFKIYGRSDENLNPKGARFSCSEIYFALEGYPGILDSVCASHYNSKLDERVVLFVKMKPGWPFTQKTETDLRETIKETLSIEHIPDLVLETPDVPYNMTGKKLNGLVKNLINKKVVPNVEVVVNPSSVEFFKNIDLGDF